VQGKADAFLYDQMSIYQFAKKHPDTTRGLLRRFSKDRGPLEFGRQTSIWENQVNAFLARFQGAQRIDALGDKYLKGRQAAFKRWASRFYF